MRKYAWLAVLAIGLGGCKDDNPNPTGGAGGSGGIGGSFDGGGTGGTGTGGTGGIAWHSAVGDIGTFVKSFDGASWTVRRVANIDLFGVACIGNLRGWAVGAGGAILHTEDSGEHWATQASGVTVALRGVRFADGQVGWAVGDAGTIVATRDGGAHWTLQAAGVSVDLHAVTAMGDGINAWAVGDGGTVLHTSNGVNWTRMSSGTTVNLYGVAVEPIGGNGWAVGESGTMLRVSQSGVAARPAITSATLRAVAVPDEMSQNYTAVAVGDFGTILTLTLGTTWSRAPSPTAATLRAALVTDFGGSFAYVAGDSGTLLMSTGPQSSWEPQDSHTTSTLHGLEDL